MFDFFKKKRKSILVNGDLTVTLVNGNQLIFHNATKEMYDLVSNKEMTDDEVVLYYYEQLRVEQEVASYKRGQDLAKKTIHQAIEAKEEKKQEEESKKEEAQKEVIIAKEIESKFPILTKTGDFEEEDGALYMVANGKRIPLTIPSTLVKKFISLIADIEKNKEDSLEEYIAVKNFWMWSSLCPNPQSREDLYGWIERNGLKINKNGFFFAYRKVVSVNGESCENKNVNKALTEFVSNAFMKVKAAKKGPRNFVVTSNESEEYNYRHVDKVPEDEDIIGNLFELHENIITDSRIDDAVDAQTYTDAHTHKMEIRIGHEVSLPADKCDWNNLQACSNGLHIRNHVDHGCGDTTILVLINPMNVVAVPVYDNSKMRVRAYFPVAVITQEEDGKILGQLNTLELAEEYHAEQIAELKTLLADNAPTEMTYHRVTTDLSPEAIKLLAKVVENPEETIKKRVINA